MQKLGLRFYHGKLGQLHDLGNLVRPHLNQRSYSSLGVNVIGSKVVSRGVSVRSLDFPLQGRKYIESLTP